MLSKLAIARASRPNALRQLEPRSFLRCELHSALCRYSKSNEYSPLSTSPSLSSSVVATRRFKSGRTGPKEQLEEAPLLGDEPPLYDGKPQWWARWAFALLALDMFFTGLSIDIVMRNWTEAVEKPSPSASLQGASSPESRGREQEYVLRPLWQRLGLSCFELAVGAAAGALILASRDRTVWRLRVRRVPLASLPPGRPGMRLPPRPAAGAAAAQAIEVLTLETGSGRTKRFLLRDCTLMPARDLSELYLRIEGIRGRFVLVINGGRVLGLRADEVDASNNLKELFGRKTESTVSWINNTPGGADPENTQIAEFRKVLARAWTVAGGSLSVPNLNPQEQKWTNGPVTGS